MRLLMTAAATAFWLGTAAPAAAQVDLDCKLLLCIPGAFPAGCADAHAYMIDRITQFPPLPPIGFCPMSDGTGYTDYALDYAFLSQQDEEGYYCRDELTLYFDIVDDDGRDDVVTFCYDPANVTSSTGSHDEAPELSYGPTEPAVPLSFRLHLVLEPGTAEQYDTGTLYTSFSTGFTVIR